MTITYFDEMSADSVKDPGAGAPRWAEDTAPPVELTPPNTFHSRYATRITQATPGIQFDTTANWHSFHFKYPTLPAERDDLCVLVRSDGTDICRVSVDDTGMVELWTTGGSWLDTGADVVADTWYQISVRSEDGTGKACRIILRNETGTTLVDYTSTDLYTQTLTGITLGRQSVVGTYTLYVDNYVCGSNDPVADIGSAVYSVVQVRANAAGDIDEFTGDYTDIDEHPADDADYVQHAGSATDYKFLARIEDVTEHVGVGSIVGVYSVEWFGSGTSGTSHETLLRTHASDYGASHFAYGGNWAFDLYLLNPFTGVAWTIQEVIDAQIGGMVTDATGGFSIYSAALEVLVVRRMSGSQAHAVFF